MAGPEHFRARFARLAAPKGNPAPPAAPRRGEGGATASVKRKAPIKAR